MGVLGNVGTYGTVNPYAKNEVGDAIDTNEAMGFKYREEKRIADAKKKADDDVKLKELEEYNKLFGVNLTGIQSLDDTTLPYAMQAKQKAGDLTKQIQSTTDFNKKSELMSQRAKIVQSFNILKQVPDMLIKQTQEIAKGVEDGKYNADDVDLIQEKFKALDSGKVHYYTDDNGNLRYTLYKVDDNGNPMGIIEKDQSVAELSKSLTPHLKSSYEDLLKKTVDNTAVKETEIQNGLKTTTTKGVDPKVKEAQAMSFGNLIASTPHEAYAFAKRYGVDEKDKEQIAKLAGEEFKKSLDSTYKEKFDLSEQRLRTENARKQEKETIDSAIAKFGDSRNDDFLTYETVTEAKGKDGKKAKVHQKHRTVISGDNLYQNMITFPESKLTFKNLGGSGSGLNGGFVEGITKDKTNGDWIITGKALKSSKIKFKTPDGKLLDLLQANEMLEAGDTPEEVKTYLKAQVDSYSAGDNYGTFTRRVKPVELSGIVLKTKFKTVENLNKALKEANQEQEQQSQEGNSKPQQPQYTNITETNKGTIGVKDGKWYDVKTGKPIQ